MVRFYNAGEKIVSSAGHTVELEKTGYYIAFIRKGLTSLDVKCIYRLEGTMQDAQRVYDLVRLAICDGESVRKGVLFASIRRACFVVENLKLGGRDMGLRKADK